MTIQALTPRILTLKVNQGTKSGTRRKPIFSVFDEIIFYFGGARSKGFATLRNVSKLQFFDKIGQAKSVGFRLYSAI